MAANAAAAAQAANALSALKSLGAKEYATSLAEMATLTEGGFDVLDDSLRRTGFANEWPAFILDVAVPEPANLTDKETVDKKNAYMLIVNKCQGHQVAHTMEPPGVPLGDAKAAYRALFDFHHRSTNAGRGEATRNFYNVTMANSNTNVVEYIALVPRKGGAPAPADQLSVLLGGLLPEFKHIVTILNSNAALTLAHAKAELLDYATSNGLLTLTKSGKINSRDKTFSTQVQEKKRGPGKVNEDCRNFKQGKCTWGDKCRFNHVGGGDTASTHLSTASAHLTNAESAPNSDYQQYESSTFMLLGDAAAEPKNVSHERFTLPPGKKNVSHKGFTLPPMTSTGSKNVSHKGFTLPPIEQPQDVYGRTIVDDDDTEIMGSSLLNFLRTMGQAVGFDFLCALLAIPFWFLYNSFAMTGGLAGAATVWTLANSNKSTVTIFFLAAMLVYQQVDALPNGGDLPSSTLKSLYTAQVYSVSSKLNVDLLEHEWCSDSGTNRFVTNNASDFVPSTVRYVNTKVAVGGGYVMSRQVGTVSVRSLDHNHVVHCENVLFIPECGKKLMPASAFVRKGCSLTYEDNKVTLYNQSKEPMFEGKEIGGLYYFRANTVRNSRFHKKVQSSKRDPRDSNSSTFFGLRAGQNTSTTSQDFSMRLLEAHWCYGHLHFDKLRALLGLKRGTNPECPACTLAKSRKTALSDNAYVRSTKSHHRMHMDIGFTRNKNYCFQVYVDDFSRVSHIDMLDSKDEVLEKWVALKDHLENANFPSKFAFIKTDSEPLYCTPDWANHVGQSKMKHEFSSRYKHDQHGVAERRMQAIGTCYTAMMYQGNAPEGDIPKAIQHANVIICDSPSRANNGRTPRERAAGMKLPVNQRLLRAPLFCLCYAHVYEEERPKGARRGIASVYLGYDPVNNAYLVREWASKQLYYTADVTFHPMTFPYRGKPDRSLSDLAQYDNMAPHITGTATQKFPAMYIREGPPMPAPLVEDGQPLNTSLVRRSQRQFDYSHSGGVPITEIRDADSFFIHCFGPDPESMEEAKLMHDANDWIAAELAEKNMLKFHKIYQVVPRSTVPLGKKIFNSKTVLKRKINPPDIDHPSGSLDKHKCRLTIAAFTKMLKQGIDYEEKHAGTVRWDSLKILIAIAVKYDFDIVLYDISSFFLYGKLADGSEMYMNIPAGWEGNDGPTPSTNVWKLCGTLYGMPHAPHEAQKVLRAAMTEDQSLRATTADDCVYVTRDPSTGYCASGTHVDDTVAIGDEKGLKKLANTLEKRFKITSKRNPTVITGVQVERDRVKKTLKLHQAAYTSALLDKYDRTDSRPVDTPMDAGTCKALMLLPTDDLNKEVITKYQQIVGALMWLMRTRPDMQFTIQLLSRFLRCATEAHIEIALGRPMKYLAGTINHGIVYDPGDGEWTLWGSSDADLAGDLTTARSTIAYASFLGNVGCISSSSILERKICNSTGMSETFAHQGLAKQICWERHLLHELGFEQKQPTKALTDNEGVQKQSTKAINHTGAKHYRISQAMIRQLNTDKVIDTDRVPTDLNCTDMLTKPLPTAAFERHKLRMMGPQDK